MIKSPHPFDTLFDSHRWAPCSLALHLCPSYVITNMAKFIQKLTPGFKNQMRNWDNFRKAVESPKSWNSMGCNCLKTTFLQLKHYTQNIYLTLLSTTCVKIHQIPLCHFWSHKSFFTTPLVYIILVQTLYTFDKDILSKCKFLDFLLLELKLIKFLVSLFKQKVSFSLNFGSLFSVMRDSSTFLAETVLDLAKRNPSMWKNSDFCLLTQYFTKIVLW